MTLAAEIGRARAALEKAEREADPAAKALDLQAGLDRLRDCEDDDPGEAEAALIRNVRAAHARRLLAQLVEVRTASLGAWLHYIGLLFGPLRPQVDMALAADPELKDRFERFIAFYGTGLRDLLDATGTAGGR
jgi:hypothetical protein